MSGSSYGGADQHRDLGGLLLDDHPQYAMATSGLLSARPAASRAGRLYFATDNNSIYEDTGVGWITVNAPKTIRLGHTFTLIGNVDAAQVVPGFFIDLPAGQTATLRHARFRLNSGTSVSVPVTVNGTTKITASVVAAAGDAADANFALADNDYVTLGTPTSLVGTPNGLSLTVYVDYGV